MAIKLLTVNRVDGYGSSRASDTITSGYSRPDRSSQGWGALFETHVHYHEIVCWFRGVFSIKLRRTDRADRMRAIAMKKWWWLLGYLWAGIRSGCPLRRTLQVPLLFYMGRWSFIFFYFSHHVHSFLWVVLNCLRYLISSCYCFLIHLCIPYHGGVRQCISSLFLFM